MLEQLVSSKLEGTLEEVSSGGGSETSQESTSTFTLDDLLEPTDHTLVVLGRVELDTGFDAEPGR